MCQWCSTEGYIWTHFYDNSCNTTWQLICMYNIIMLMYYNMYTMLHLATKVFFFYWEIVGYGMSVGGHSVAR